VIDGRFGIPDRCGLGVTIRKEFVQKYRHSHD
jgi:L-alanine-DL-glutamate epimerase-like enolase superfamily enzyme